MSEFKIGQRVNIYGAINKLYGCFGHYSQVEGEKGIVVRKINEKFYQVEVKTKDDHYFASVHAKQCRKLVKKKKKLQSKEKTYGCPQCAVFYTGFIDYDNSCKHCKGTGKITLKEVE